MKSTILFSRALELIGGGSTALLGLFLFLRIFSEALSLGEPIKPRTDLKVFLILALPGIVVAVGSYFHAIRRKQWAVIVVFIGGIANVALVGLNAGLAYALIQDIWGRIGIFADCAATALTMGLALVNAIVLVTFEAYEKPRQYG